MIVKLYKLMKDDRKYVFVGDRAGVLKEMIHLGLSIKRTFVIENSFLHNLLKIESFISYDIITNKQQLLEKIKATDYDILISNGCKYILPISNLKKAIYINIHPSYLPDLKGKNPINGALLYDRDCGATCHEMDDGIDTGKIIAREYIPVTDDIDAALLYQLCFKAEITAFRKAYEKNFIPLDNQPLLENPIYYSVKEEDFNIKFDKGFNYVLRQVKAFGYPNKGLYFVCKNNVYHFYKASEITNPYVLKYCQPLDNLCVAFSFENSIVFKFEDRVMRFDAIEESCWNIKEGDVLSSAFQAKH